MICIRPSLRLFAVPPALLLAGAALWAGPAATIPDHFPTSDDLRHLKSMGGPQLSPDGATALFTFTDATADGGRSHLWLTATNGSDKARQVTFSPPADKRGEHNPQWSADGSAILFLAHREENTQIFRLDLRGGEAAPYDLKVVPAVDESKEKNAIPPPEAAKKDEKKTGEKGAEGAQGSEPVEIDVSGFALSADGKWLAVWARDPKTSGEKKQSEAKADAAWINHDKHASRLYLAALGAGGVIEGALKPVAIAPDVRGAVWSPASDRMVVFTEAPNDLSDLGPAGSAWVVDAAAPDTPSRLEDIPATVGGGAWRPDGSEIVFSAATPEDAPPGYDELFALPLAPPRSKPERLTAGFAGQLNASALSVAPDGTVFTAAAMGTRSTVVRIDGSGKRSPVPVDLRPQHQPRANRLALGCRRRSSTSEAVLCPSPGRSLRRAPPARDGARGAALRGA
jgi:dipeptidyl aminopeptidase/acylaminoacyl peptidase